MNIISPKLQWKGILTPLKLNSIRFIVIHHIEAFNATIENIHSWHIQNGWTGIGYNEYIRKDGSVYIGRGDNVGAHTLNWNTLTYGIALEGDYSKESIVPEAQYLALVERCKFNLKRFKKDCGIVGHNDLMATECPGQHFAPYMTRLVKDVVRKDVGNLTRNEALNVLYLNKKINAPDYWAKVCEIVKYEDELIIEYAKTVLENNELKKK